MKHKQKKPTSIFKYLSWGANVSISFSLLCIEQCLADNFSKHILPEEYMVDSSTGWSYGCRGRHCGRSESIWASHYGLFLEWLYADVEDVLSMSWIETIRTSDSVTDRITKSAKVNYLFTNRMVSTFLSHCEVSFRLISASMTTVFEAQGNLWDVVREQPRARGWLCDEIQRRSCRIRSPRVRARCWQWRTTSLRVLRSRSIREWNPIQRYVLLCALKLVCNGRGAHLRSAHMEHFCIWYRHELEASENESK